MNILKEYVSIYVHILRKLRRKLPKLNLITWVTLGLFIILTPIIYVLFFQPKKTDAAWYNNGWSKRKTITIDDAQVSGSSDLTNFPVLISLTDSDLATSAQSDADDILFTSVDGSTKLDHEIERYTSGTGALVAWVEIPTLATATDTVIYMYYGNSSASNQENVTGTWNSNFAAVYHMAEDPSITTDGDCGGGTAEVCDSTSNNRDLDMFGSMPSGALISGGRVGSAIDFDGANDALVATGYDISELTAHTVSYWINPDTISQFDTHWTTDEDNADTALYYDTNALTWCNSTSCGNFARTNTGVYTADTWHHVVAIYNGSGTATILINGVNQTADSTLDESTETGAFVIGNWETGTNNEATDGYIDEFKISTTNLSTDWAITEYNNQNSPSTFYSVGSQQTQTNAEGTLLTPSLYWAMDEGVGSTLNDRTGNSNSGTITNALWRTEDLCVSGKCLFFDGSGDFVSRASDTDFDFTYNGSVSVTGWFRHEPVTSGTDIILARHNGAVDGGFKLYMESDGDITCGLDRDSTFSPEDSVTSTAATYDDNQWHHVACVKNSNTSLTLYIDGNSVGTPDTSLQSSGTYANTDILYLGIDGDGSSNGWEGFLDEFKFFNGALSSAQIKADMASRGSFRGVAAQFGQQDTSFLNDGLVGYWPMDETAANSCTGGTNDSCDRSGNGNDAAWAASTADPSIASGKFGNGVDFDGDDYSSVADSSSLDITSQITLSGWIYMDTVDSNERSLMSKSNGSEDGVYNLIFDGPNSQKFRLELDSGGGYRQVSSTTTPSTNTWYHILGTFDGKALKIYVNGQLEATTLHTGSIATNNSTLRLGDHWVAFMDGRMDELRVYNRALSSAEVKQLYNWAPGPVGYWTMDENTGSSIFDISGNNTTGTLTNFPSTPWSSGKFGSALRFDGTNDLINLGSPTPLDALSEITVSAWIYPTGWGGSSFGRIIDKDGSNDLSFLLRNDTSQQSIEFFRGRGITSAQADASNNSISLNRWQHVAGTFSSSSNLIRLYINGQEASYATQTNGSGTITDDSADTLYIGNRAAEDRAFDGYIDDVKIYNYARTPSQIVEDMNGGHPVGGSPVGSQALYWKFDEGFGTTAYSAVPNKQNGTLGNMASPATATSGWNLSGKINNSLTFDGSNDVVTLATASDADVDFNGSEPFSLSSWIYVTTMPGSGERDLIVGKWEDDGTPQRAYRLTVTNDDADTTGNLRAEVYDESADTMIGAATANDTIATNTWYHALMTFSGCTSSCPTSTVKVYLNGQDKGSSVTSGSFAGLEDMSADFTVGEYDTNDNAATDTPFTGRIDDVQVFSSELSSDSVQIVYNMNNAVNFGVGAPTPEPAQLSDGAGNPPIGWWSFDENTGTSAFDSSGNELTGTLNGMSQKPWIIGKIGSALNFDGVNDYVSIADTTLLHPGNESWTVSAWSKPPSNSTGHLIVGKRDNSTLEMYALWICGNIGCSVAGQQLHGVFQESSGGNRRRVLSDIDVVDGNWHYYSMVADKAADRVRIYMDGIELAASTTSNSGSWPTVNNTDILEFGAASALPAYTIGPIDEVKIYNYARTPAQIAYDYNRGAPVGWWKFDECSGSTAYDATGRGNNGTITPGGSGNTAVGTCTSGTSTHMWNNGVAGKFNSSLDFDGSDDYVSLGDLSYAEGVSQLSWSVWVKPATAVNACILCKYNASAIANESWRIYADSTPANLLIGISANSTDTLAYGTVANVFSNGTWTHVVGVYDGTQSGNANRLKIYINGKPATVTFNSTIPASLQSNSTNIRVGSSNDSIDNYDGLIDEVQMYNYPLSATQVLKIYNDNSSVFFGPNTGSP